MRLANAIKLLSKFGDVRQGRGYHRRWHYARVGDYWVSFRREGHRNPPAPDDRVRSVHTMPYVEIEPRRPMGHRGGDNRFHETLVQAIRYASVRHYDGVVGGRYVYVEVCREGPTAAREEVTVEIDNKQLDCSDRAERALAKLAKGAAERGCLEAIYDWVAEHTVSESGDWITLADDGA
jgi:hypothetical protein